MPNSTGTVAANGSWVTIATTSKDRVVFSPVPGATYDVDCPVNTSAARGITVPLEVFADGSTVRARATGAAVNYTVFDEADSVSLTAQERAAVTALVSAPRNPARVATETTFPYLPNGATRYKSVFGFSGTNATGVDENGFYLEQSVSHATGLNSKVPCTPGASYILAIKAKGRMPNKIEINYFTAANAYVSNSFVYMYSSTVSDVSAIKAPYVNQVMELAKTFTANAGGTITQMYIRFFYETDMTGTNLPRYYGWFIEATANVAKFHRKQIDLPFRGVGCNQMLQLNRWSTEPTVTPALIDGHIQFLQDSFGLTPGDAIRVFVTADAGIQRVGGIPDSFTPLFWTNVAALVTAISSRGLKLIPVLFWPLEFYSTSPLQFDRTAAANPAKAAGYEKLAEELARYFHTVACVPALDVLNEYAFNMTFTPTAGVSDPGYTPEQTARLFEALARGCRRGTDKPLIASCATGKDLIPVLAIQDPASYDIISYHSYNSNAGFFQPMYDKPIIAGEYGPDVFEADAGIKQTQVAAVQAALPGLVGAAWMWSDYGVIHPTVSVAGSIRDSVIVNAYKAARETFVETGVRRIY